jgi:hypothetical protein
MAGRIDNVRRSDMLRPMIDAPCARRHRQRFVDLEKI